LVHTDAPAIGVGLRITLGAKAPDSGRALDIPARSERQARVTTPTLACAPQVISNAG
jgi:hypothetical protein